MKKLDTVYKIEVTAEEVEAITTALHGEYKFIKSELDEVLQDSKKATFENIERIKKRLDTVRAIRNNFADICNRRYMGEDA